MMEIKEVRFEHFAAGDCLGIGATKPRISWRNETTQPGWKQVRYELQARSSGYRGEMSKMIISNECHLVEWPFPELESRDQTAIRVRVWGNRDPEPSPWSGWNVVEIGLLEKDDWKSQMISASFDTDPNGPKPEVLFRKEFNVNDSLAIMRARLYCTAEGVYEAEINGKKVGDQVLAPGWTSYKHRILQQVYDVTNDLVSGGANAIGIRVSEGWFSGRLGFFNSVRNNYGYKRSIIAQLEIAYADGTVVTVGTDETWKANEGPVRLGELYSGEKYDANYEIPDWSSPGLNTDQWSTVVAGPVFSEAIEPPVSSPVKKIEILKPVKLITTPSGKSVLDFGQNIVGYLHMNGVNHTKGATVTLSHAEVMENDEICTRTLRTACSVDKYTFKGDPEGEEYEPRSTFHGFRFAQVEGWPRGVELSDFNAVVIHTVLEQTGWFSCSNELVNRLYENVRWSTKGNFVGLPTDCPQRDERLGWTGDIQVFSSTALYTHNCTGLLRNWLKDLWLEQNDADGIPQSMAPCVIPEPEPDSRGRMPTAVWGDATVVVPWNIYVATGDKKILEEQFPSASGWLKSIPLDGDNILWEADRFQYADWLDPRAPDDNITLPITDRDLVADAYLAHVLNLGSKIAVVLGRDCESKEFADRFDKVKKKFQKKYINPESGVMLSHTQTAYTLAIRFGLLSPDQYKAAGDHLKQLVVDSDYKISTGFAGTCHVSHALTDIGSLGLAYDMLLEKECPSWLYPVTMGATTIWERWNSMAPDGSVVADSMTSFNHYALGAVADWLHRVSGITPVEPGWKRIRIEPLPSNDHLTYMDTSHMSPYGLVRSKWSVNGDGNELTLEGCTPPNVEAEVVLPDGKIVSVESGEFKFVVHL